MIAQRQKLSDANQWVLRNVRRSYALKNEFWTPAENGEKQMCGFAEGWGSAGLIIDGSPGFIEIWKMASKAVLNTVLCGSLPDYVAP